MNGASPQDAAPVPAPQHAWWRELDRSMWWVLFVAALGWLFDVMDQRIFNLSRNAALDELLAVETRDVILHAIDALPPAQREVLVLRDLDELTGAETCNILGLTDTHQRVLLHRARSRVRAALEGYFLHSRSATTEAT